MKARALTNIRPLGAMVVRVAFYYSPCSLCLPLQHYHVRISKSPTSQFAMRNVYHCNSIIPWANVVCVIMVCIPLKFWQKRFVASAGVFYAGVVMSLVAYLFMVSMVGNLKWMPRMGGIWRSKGMYIWKWRQRLRWTTSSFNGFTRNANFVFVC